ncbi:hypothetical protein P280DRAFT_471583 [Massarina eburnea CBS 473.64]|uniref:N-acetyltransferase domain-containing protein n=1 Tax=Massarina eburnea CBS 473.64 TaxID=1395130 RepID=A0A6A6RU48_9PLEO|nr:hypothetical protein P280DRAFT_471583 [Massarina eburnea CBS 473.64]
MRMPYTIQETAHPTHASLNALFARSTTRFSDPVSSPCLNPTTSHTFIATPSDIPIPPAAPIALISFVVDQKERHTSLWRKSWPEKSGSTDPGTQVVKVVRAAVAPEFAGKGVEQMLFREVERWAEMRCLDRVGVTLAEDMVRETEMLEALGYRMVGWRRDGAYGKVFTLERML